MKKEKSVIMVAYYFPPYANVSTVRTTKYCKYLPKFGWTPHVLTVDEQYYQGRVLPLSSFELGETTISRIPYFSFPMNVLCIKIFFPFIVFAYIFKHRHEIDVVYFSGSPFHPFILSVVIDIFLKKRTILDFRDSWSTNHGFDGQGADSWFAKTKQWLTRQVEKHAIRFASNVIFATTVLQQEYEELYPKFKRKYKTIPNGYDPDDFLGLQPIKITDKTTLILAGQFNLYTPVAINALMGALRALPNLHFIYIGNEADVIREIAITCSVEASVTTYPYLPYKEVLRYVAGANYALLSNGMRNGMGTKIFDYLALNKAVLCFVPKGSVITQQFSELESVIIFEPPYTAALLTQKLEELMQIKGTEDVSAALKEFTRDEATKKLVHTFDEGLKDDS